MYNFYGQNDLTQRFPLLFYSVVSRTHACIHKLLLFLLGRVGHSLICWTSPDPRGTCTIFTLQQIAWCMVATMHQELSGTDLLPATVISNQLGVGRLCWHNFCIIGTFFGENYAGIMGTFRELSLGS